MRYLKKIGSLFLMVMICSLLFSCGFQSKSTKASQKSKSTKHLKTVPFKKLQKIAGKMHYKGRPFSGKAFLNKKKKKVKEAFYVNGLKHGNVTHWWRNGKKKYESKFVHGEKAYTKKWAMNGKKLKTEKGAIAYSK